MEKVFQQYKFAIIITLSIVAVAIWQYYRGKKAGNTTVPEIPYPNGGQTIPSNWNPNPLAEELYRVMNGGFTNSVAKENAWKKLLYLQNNESIIAVYNVFNKKYASKGKGSLTQWIDDEYYYDWFNTVKPQLLSKLRSLNLK